MLFPYFYRESARMSDPEIRFPLDQDPELEWESQKYADPIPSRQYILQALNECKGPAQADELITAFGLQSPAQLDAFQRRLGAMQRSGQLIQTRTGAYGLVAKMDLAKGRVQGHKEGFGFFIPDDGTEDMFLSPKQMRCVFDGDRVLARAIFRDKRGRQNGAVIEILERNTTSIVGRYCFENGLGFVVPDNKRISQEIMIAPDNIGKAKPGQYVVVAIIVPPDYRHQAQGKIVDVLGVDHTPGIEMQVALHTHSIPHIWPEAVELEARSLPTSLELADFPDRVDLTGKAFVTIDGEDAKDFDDAVYAEKTAGGGWDLWVAIADVSHYVVKDSSLDQEARLRSTSVYFPNCVIPMLPEALSNHLCSLRPNENRLALVCKMSVTRKGSVSSFVFMEAMIRSQARLTYTCVSDWLTQQKPFTERIEGDFDAVMNNVGTLHALFKVLLTKRQARGAIDFDTTETQIVFNDHGKIEAIYPRTRNDAHRLIEECMLLANTCTAECLLAHELPALYRVHGQPKEEKLEQVNEFLSSLGLKLPVRKKVQPKDYQKILGEVKGRPDFHLIQTVLLRSMQQARYVEENAGHFGLAYEAYTHFTSPIRRYPDLVVHRALRYLIRSRLPSEQVVRVPKAARVLKKNWLEISAPKLSELGEHCSFAERRADEATRQATDWLKCEYMQDKVGLRFTGVIAGVVHFGLFVELDSVYVEGLVHVSSLASDYYTFDAARHCLLGERTRQEYRLGDAVSVVVAKVDLEARQMDFILDEVHPPLPPRSAKKTATKKHKSAADKSSSDKNKSPDKTKTEVSAEKLTTANGDKPAKKRRKRRRRSKPSE